MPTGPKCDGGTASTWLEQLVSQLMGVMVRLGQVNSHCPSCSREGTEQDVEEHERESTCGPSACFPKLDPGRSIHVT